MLVIYFLTVTKYRGELEKLAVKYDVPLEVVCDSGILNLVNK